MKLYQVAALLPILLHILLHILLPQVRHADVSANAVGVFFGLGVALFLETISIYYNGPTFWFFFCLFMLTTLVSSSMTTRFSLFCSQNSISSGSARKELNIVVKSPAQDL